MNSIFSKPTQNNLNLETDQPCTSFEPNVQACDQFDADLIDKIKLAIAKLKATTKEHCPRKNRFAKFPCSVCDKNCNKNQDAIYCTSCSQWVHGKCNCRSKTEYNKLSDEPDDVPFHCMLCVMKENSEIFPHFFLDKSQLLELNGIDLPSQLKFLESYDIKSRLMNMPNLHDFDMDENLIHKVNSHYYDNVNLLNYNTHNYTNEFMNNMISHYLLPHILHPMRVTDHSAMIIDNIFSNNTSHETVSGNIMIHISDHFPQFIILNKTNIDYKRCSFSKRDFSKFDEQKFVDSFAGNNLDFLADREVSLNQKFDLFYQNLSSHVEHHAP